MYCGVDFQRFNTALSYLVGIHFVRADSSGADKLFLAVEQDGSILVSMTKGLREPSSVTTMGDEDALQRPISVKT
jgi:hypothetical protein